MPVVRYDMRTRVYHTVVGESEVLYADTGWMAVNHSGEYYNESGSAVTVDDTHALGSYSAPNVFMNNGYYTIDGNDLILTSGSAWVHSGSPKLLNPAINESGHNTTLVGSDGQFLIRTLMETREA